MSVQRFLFTVLGRLNLIYWSVLGGFA